MAEEIIRTGFSTRLGFETQPLGARCAVLEERVGLLGQMLLPETLRCPKCPRCASWLITRDGYKRARKVRQGLELQGVGDLQGVIEVRGLSSWSSIFACANGPTWLLAVWLPLERFRMEGVS